MSADTKRIEELVVLLSENPDAPELNFAVAEEYAKHDQWASAVSFYLRCMEFGYETHREHVYASLLKLAHAFDTQNDRLWTVSGAILQAIAYEPERPEAWFYLARYHERKGDWQECYTYATMGMSVMYGFTPLPTQTDYIASWCLQFEQAVAGWWIGRAEESKAIFEGLLKKPLTPDYVAAVKSNLARIA